MKTLRSYMRDLQASGDLLTIDEPIDSHLQASATCAMSQRVGGPAVHFTNVKNGNGASLVGALLAGPGYTYPRPRKLQRRVSLGLGLPADTQYEELMEVLLERRRAPIRALEVGGGPVEECRVVGKDVDLSAFPFPHLHQADGGRYLTSHVVLTREPDTGWTNWGVYRLQIVGRNKLVQGNPPPSPNFKPPHTQGIVEKYAARKEPMPFAIAVGVSPAQLMAGAMNTPQGTDEAALAGGLTLEPVPMMKSQLSDILVPADAEMILEGHVYPGDTAEEGPFTDISRLMPKTPGYVYTVESISHRKDPIIPFVAHGAKTADSLTLYSILHSAELMEIIQSGGFEVRWVTVPVEGNGCVAFVSFTNQNYTGRPARVSRYVFGFSRTIEQVYLLDDDLDAEDFAHHINDTGQKAHPIRDFHYSDIDRIVSPTANHDHETGLTSTLYVDATWRIDRPLMNRPKRVSYKTSFPPEIQERVRKRYEELGLGSAEDVALV